MIGIDLSKLAGVYYNDVLVDALVLGNTIVWESKPSEPSQINEPLHFYVNPGDIPVELDLMRSPDVYLEYSTNKTDWKEWNVGALTVDEAGIYIRGNNPNGFSNYNDINNFVSSGWVVNPVQCEGNIMSLLGETITEIPCDYCFQRLFYGLSIETAPVLPAKVLTEGCYQHMFEHTEYLRRIEIHATDISAPYCLEYWVNGVSMDGIFICDCNVEYIQGFDSGIPHGWTVKCISEPTVDVSKALKFTAVDNSVDLGFENNEGIELYWSDGFTDFALWDGTPLTISQEDSIYIKGRNTSFYSTKGYKRFTTSGNGKLKCEGSVMYLLGEDVTEITETGCFLGLFSDCTNLKTAPELPATTLTMECYSSMFIGCTSLVTAPELPATTIADYCYDSMFSDCTSLVTAPELPATELATQCYAYMFYGCTSLRTAPELPATILPDYCYTYMFYGCTSLVTAPELPATALAYYCYQYMFYGCTSLTTAPELPATILANSCYSYMFNGCTSLTTAPKLPATTLADYCYQYMFANCKNLKYAPELLAPTVKPYCYAQMFQNCTSLTTNFIDGGVIYDNPIVLHANNFATYCYYQMFQGCTSIQQAVILATVSNSQSNCCSYMFDGCTSLTKIVAMFSPPTSFLVANYQKSWVNNVAPSGTFVCNAQYSSSWTTRANYMPTGWTKTTQ